ncbi:MAG: hypothetical protein KIT84_42915 [Labilithrix sp.]|nr:hypothetical protein [Labilithrix sp.]MCW5817831.1 hypothetical protein [Labilithrix sp.]
MIDALLGEDAARRKTALDACEALADHERFTLANEIAVIARRTADALAHADEHRGPTTAHAAVLGRAALTLSMLRGEVARSTLIRIAEERSYAVKSALARALRETKTAEGRSVLVYLLSDDDAQADAIVAIGAAPWPEILPSLIEVAEADDRAARLAARPIARCGATAGAAEANAAASFLFEQLDDDAVVIAAADALVRYGAAFPGVEEQARRLVKEDNPKRMAGLCLLAATTAMDAATLRALAGPKRETDERLAHSFLRPLRADGGPKAREAAERTWRALKMA